MALSRLISQAYFCQIIFCNFLRSFHKIRCDPVAAFGGVAIISETREIFSRLKFHMSFFCHRKILLELFREKCCLCGFLSTALLLNEVSEKSREI